MLLPQCYHRGGEISSGRWGCGHPGLMAPQGVSAEDCIRCEAGGIFCNKKPADIHTTAGPTQMPSNENQDFPCIHRGAAIDTMACKPCGGREMPVYACGLPAHGRCTILSHGYSTSELKSPTSICVTCDDRLEVKQRKAIISDACCPGDVAVLTAAVNELMARYPKGFALDVRTNHSALWEGSPHVTPLDDTDPEAERCSIHYDPEKHFPNRYCYATINQSSQRPIHMLEAYCEGLSAALGIEPLRPHKWLEPSIWLTPAEKGWVSQVQERTGKQTRFWLINAGMKNDYTCKLWPFYQQVVNSTKHRINWVQIGSAKDVHKPLDGVALNLIGKTDLRQLVRLVYHSSGVLCGVTALMHLAHWVERPQHVPFRRNAVIIAGGRESPSWFSYPGHHVFHTIGELDCCSSGGCWKSRVVPLPDGDADKNRSLCTHSVEGFPLCMNMISPDEVSARLLRLAGDT